jgi:acetyl esterase/lipase
MNNDIAKQHIPMATLPDEQRRLMEQIGPIWGTDIGKHRDLVVQTYTTLLERQSDGGVRATRGIAYGPHERHKLDVYQTERGSRMPVVMFVHGGAFIRGARDVNTQIYSNVARYFARKGFLGINVGYRLAPEARYPDGSLDVGAAVAWARAHVREYGGDPERIFLVGHSAGGTHVATYVADPRARPAEGHCVCGIVLLSARLRIEARPDNPNAAGVRAYYGDDAWLYEERSPVTHAANIDVPVFIVTAEYDNPYLDIYGLELAHRLGELHKRAPRFTRTTRHNHISLVAHFHTDEEILGLEILDFIERS